MTVTAETIHEYFDRYDWTYDYEESIQTWHTGFRGKASNFNVFVHLSENWIIFSIAPFVNRPEEPRCRENLHAYLLKLNYVINMAKFSIDDDGDVVLTVELPTEGFTYSDFSDGLNAVSFYADAHHLNVMNVALDPDYVPEEREEWVSKAGEDPDGRMN